MPVTAEGQEILRSKPTVLYIPGKAANAGGVGVSGLEMSQNAGKTYWTREKVDVSVELSLLLLVYLDDINFTHRFPYRSC